MAVLNYTHDAASNTRTEQQAAVVNGKALSSQVEAFAANWLAMAWWL
jgi:hypothetical protein